MCCSVLLVLDFLYHGATPVVIVAALAVLYLALWFVLGVARRLRGKPDS